MNENKVLLQFPIFTVDEVATDLIGNYIVEEGAPVFIQEITEKGQKVYLRVGDGNTPLKNLPSIGTTASFDKIIIGEGKAVDSAIAGSTTIADFLKDYNDAFIDNNIEELIASLKPAEASGLSSMTLGPNNMATKSGSIAIGWNNTSSGFCSIALGMGNKATGPVSFVEGGNNTATGYYSHTEGCGNNSSKNYTHSEGYHTNASGNAAHTEGAYTNAIGENSHAGGEGTKAKQKNQTAIGQYNADDIEALFIVGNGTTNKPSNAFVVHKDGTAYVSDSKVITENELNKVITIEEEEDDETIAKIEADNIFITDGSCGIEMSGGNINIDNFNIPVSMYEGYYISYVASQRWVNNKFATQADLNKKTQGYSFYTATDDECYSGTTAEINADKIFIKDNKDSGLIVENGQAYISKSGFSYPIATQLYVMQEIAKAQVGGDSDINLDAYAEKEYVNGLISGVMEQISPLQNKTNCLTYDSTNNTHAISINKIVIGTGANNANKTITGGTTDKSFVEGVVNEVFGDNALINALLPLPKLNPSQANAEMSIAIGADNVSSAVGAITYGYDNESSGWCSTASGALNTTTGALDLAIGYKNKVSGNFGVAIGTENTVSKDGGIAIGNLCVANGKRSFALGNECETHNNYAVAIGGDCKAYGQRSVALGNENTASLDYAFACGTNNKATGHASFVANQGNEAKNYAFAEGYNNKAYGDHCHAEGSTTIANGMSSHTEGWNTMTGADAEGAHAEGWQTQALHNASHAGGYQTKTSNNYQTVIGTYNEDDSDALFIVGNGNSEEVHPADGLVGRRNAFTVKNNGTVEISGSLTIGNTTFTEAQLKKILNFINSIEITEE